MNNSKRRRLAKATKKIRGNDSMTPNDKNLARIMQQKGNRKERRA